VLIDWFTVLAQIINFLILIYLLKRFLYGPIIKAMEKREKNMVAALDRAKNAEKEALQRSLDLEKEKESLMHSKERLLAEAKADVDAWRENTLKASKEEIEALRKSWMDRLNADQQDFLNALKRRIVEQIIRISDKVLKDLANENLDTQTIRVFLEKVSLKKDEFSQDDLTQTVSVQSGMPLSDDQAQGIRERFSQWFPTTSPLQFTVRPDLGMGIQIIAGDRKVAWNLAEYLEELEKEIMAGLFTPKVTDTRVIK
jgi:F-type H+-transporting ATPase subunit b